MANQGPSENTRREFLRICGHVLSASAVLTPVALLAQSQGAAAGTAGPVAPELLDDLVAANYILASEGVVDGFGHVSVRREDDPQRFLLARSIAPASVTASDIMEFGMDGEPVITHGRATVRI